MTCGSVPVDAPSVDFVTRERGCGAGLAGDVNSCVGACSSSLDRPIYWGERGYALRWKCFVGCHVPARAPGFADGTIHRGGLLRGLVCGWGASNIGLGLL